MTVTRTASVLAVMASLMLAGPCLAQTPAAQTPAASTPQPTLTPAEMEQFLVRGEIVKIKSTKKGVTDARRLTMSDGRVTHDAQLQDVDIALPIFNVDPKHTEVNFRDTYRYNIAGYRLALLLGLDNVPMSVPRRVKGKDAAITWWLDDVMFDEGKRKNQMGPNPGRTAGQLHVLRVFDELIQNRDRNAGNLLWTNDWKMWMIDHTRAFRLGKTLLNAAQLQRCDRTMFEKMRALTAAKLTEVMGENLKKDEIEALLIRRDVIVKLFTDKIATSNESAVLFSMAE